MTLTYRYRRVIAYLVTVLMIEAMLAGCKVSVFESTPVLTAAFAATATQETLPTFEARPTDTLSPTRIAMTPTVESASVIPTQLASDSVQCIVPKQDEAQAASLASGLVATGTWGQAVGIGVLGTDGWSTPEFAIASSEFEVVPSTSPKGEWLAYATFVGPTSSSSIELTAQRFSQSISQTTTISLDQPSMLILASWVNETQFAIPLEAQADAFTWIIWAPETNQQTQLTISLPDIGRTDRFEHIVPQLDPTLQMVVYACDGCASDEYRVRDTGTGNLLWSIDLGIGARLSTSPLWSPDGNYLAIMDTDNSTATGLLIFDRHGVIVYEYELPNVNGFVSAGNLQWSPNSQYLSFSRFLPDPVTQVRTTIALITMISGKLIDLCLDPGDYVWSPDSTMIATSSQIDTSSRARIVSIILPEAGAAYVFDDPKGHALQGWIIPIQP